ncbi:YbhB/YbcL family Raf kinase inhibitor-like protein [Legionella worsleiensis]|uniref:Phosphatidylethanolamine-binding protein n=1 Tax=Legionella worsleiensis TaxID=45076 RepID=A0A0W1AH39_9GAMM|nr:YbhB/YbcL family Raf kinase inhibitor-like protein [Legionella worsleiensis]KTD80682.1 phosphatidylethanolamine-binding protein [Legionella worsleiensis]STY32740.1 phosphatidylethanolamine-binding protein [Legionella worsleiensis]
MKNLLVFFFLLPGIVHMNCYAANFTLESSAFKPNSMIPDQYSCSGANIPPPLAWQNVPPNAQSLALVVSDPDAQDGEWIHWMIFNIPPTVTQFDATSALPDGAVNGTNSWGTVGYKGPCPPLGVHRYVFTLYALDNVLNLEQGANKTTVLNAMTGHVIGSAELTGLYQKF